MMSLARVFVPALGDAEQLGSPAGRYLPGHHAQPRSEIASATEGAAFNESQTGALPAATDR